MIHRWITHRIGFRIGFLLVAVIFGLSGRLFAQTPTEAVTSGTQWLLSARYNMSIWAFNAPPDPLQEEFTVDDYTKTYVRDTLEAVKALQAVNSPTTEYEPALDWVEFFRFPSTEQIGQKAQILSKAGRDTSKVIDTILSARNSDGGFGGRSGYPSNVLDTAFALQALAAVQSSDSTTIYGGINYLLSAQNPDGGFGFYQGKNSNVCMTSLVSHVLQQFPQTTSLATAITKATGYIISQQQTNGGFTSGGASAAPTIYETALAYIALVGVTTDNTVLGNAVNYITSTQSANGSWNEDPYSTALALRALYYSQNKPTPPPVPPAEITPVNEDPSATETTVKGKVTDASTGQPIPGADITVIGTNLSAKTDSTGAYTLSGVTDLSFSIRASAAGYDSLTYNVTATAYGIYTVDFALTPSPAGNLKITSASINGQTYSANSDVSINAVIENTGSESIDTLIVAHINDDKGKTIALAYPSEKEIILGPFSKTLLNIVWNTGQISPGNYTIILKVTDAATITYGGLAGVTLVEKAIPIIIEPYVGMSNIAVRLQPGYTHVGATETVKIGMAYTNTSNIPADLTAEYTIKTPSGVIIQNGAQQFPLSLDVVSTTAPLSSLVYTFNESGNYPVEAIGYREGIELYRVNSSFTVQSNIRIDLNRTVTPQTLLPGGNGKVKIIIDLKGVEIK